MRIAFVGKGGSGKTTLSALFTLFVKEKSRPVLLVDADLNAHLPRLLDIGRKINNIDDYFISDKKNVKRIKKYLIGKNKHIKSLDHFRKTTPPTAQSNFLVLDDKNDFILNQFCLKKENVYLMVVGTYSQDDIGASCYHNNLSVFENILSHTIDKRGYLITDMIAGVDAFANTLHAQFDMLIMVVEPTKRSIEVFDKYISLAKNAGVDDLLFVVGNKVRNVRDKKFIAGHIPKKKIIGYLSDSKYLRTNDQREETLNINLLEKKNVKLLDDIDSRLIKCETDYQKRINKLYAIHRRYVSQDFIKERFGDLTGQIDASFNFLK